MPHVVRLGDLCTGHGCWPPRGNCTASPNVLTNNIPQHRLTDKWPPHCCPAVGCHPGTTVQGSPNVFVNMLAIARQGDAVSCGSRCNQHSPDVIANG